jgi:hypothetical protein
MIVFGLAIVIALIVVLVQSFTSSSGSTTTGTTGTTGLTGGPGISLLASTTLANSVGNGIGNGIGNTGVVYSDDTIQLNNHATHLSLVLDRSTFYLNTFSLSASRLVMQQSMIYLDGPDPPKDVDSYVKIVPIQGIKREERERQIALSQARTVTLRVEQFEGDAVSRILLDARDLIWIVPSTPSTTASLPTFYRHVANHSNVWIVVGDA